ncbi:hypothetical protein EDC01DRAFT_609618, partial [Geopyxis carbonaria]
RRESFETLPESDIGFPGCYVLVPSQEPPHILHSRRLSEPRMSGVSRRTRRPMADSDRAAVKKNRRFGVCLRCKMFKEKCRGADPDQGIPCERCSSLKIWRGICVPALFADKNVFSREIYRSRAKILIDNIHSWNSAVDDYPIEVEVHNGYQPTLNLTVHRFVPRNENLLEHILWREVGTPRFSVHPSTPYGLKGELTPEEIDTYIDSHVELFIKELADVEGPHNVMYRQTSLAAYEYSRSGAKLAPLVRKALRIWAAQSFFFSSAWRICGSNTLGMEQIQDRDSKLYGLTPLPRLINQQLDGYVEGRVAILEEELLEELQKCIFKKESVDWFGTYLTMFVVLSSLERDTWALHTWVFDSPKLHERSMYMEIQHPNMQKAWTWPLSGTPQALIKKNYHLVDMLVAHFRAITKGYIPFSLDWSTEQTCAMAGNDPDALEYMRTVGTWFKGMEPVLMDRQNAQYSRTNCQSLTSSFTSKLMTSKECF